MFRLNHDGTLANKVGSGEWHNVETSAAYLTWLSEGNIPEPAPIPVAPVELTTEQKLEAAGLTVDELKALFGLT